MHMMKQVTRIFFFRKPSVLVHISLYGAEFVKFRRFEVNEFRSPLWHVNQLDMTNNCHSASIEHVRIARRTARRDNARRGKCEQKDLTALKQQHLACDSALPTCFRRQPRILSLHLSDDRTFHLTNAQPSTSDQPFPATNSRSAFSGIKSKRSLKWIISVRSRKNFSNLRRQNIVIFIYSRLLFSSTWEGHDTLFCFVLSAIF